MALTPDDLKAIGELITASSEGLRGEMQAIAKGLREEIHASAEQTRRDLREDIKAEGTRVIDEITEVLTGITEVASEKDAELEKRIEHLEKHTGLAKHN